MRTSRLLAVGLAGLLVLTFSARPTFASSVRSDVTFTPSAATAAYDIEAYNYYCTGGGSSCLNDSDGFTPAVSSCLYLGNACPGLSYGDAEAYGLPNGSSTGTPAAMYLECQQFTATGYRQAIVSVYSVSGAATYGGIESDQGVIGGKATLLDWTQQNPDFNSNLDADASTAQGSSINASSFDPYGGWNGQGTRGSVTGIQNTDNTTDTLNSGTFTITISGEIDTFDDFGEYLSSTTGTISCQAGGPHAYDLADAGPDLVTRTTDLAYNEGELAWDYAQAPDMALTISCTANGATHSADCAFAIKNVGTVTATSPFSVAGDLEISGSNPAVSANASAGPASCAATSTLTKSSSSSGVAAAFAFVGCTPPVTLAPNASTTVVNVEVSGSATSSVTFAIVGTVGRVPGEINLTNNTYYEEGAA